MKRAARRGIGKSCYLAFPPGWSLCCGGPHVGIPAIAAFLRVSGIDVHVTDLNLAWARSRSAVISSDEAVGAGSGSLVAMNTVYFAKEDPLQELALSFGGEWNLQTGFHYKSPDVYRLAVALECARRVTPFTEFFVTKAVPDVLAFDPDVVGLSVAAWQQLIPALELAMRLREAGFDGCIVLGGNTVSRLADALSCAELFKYVDVLGLFAGERTMLDIVEAADGGNFENVDDVVWSDGGAIRRSAKRTKIADRVLPGPDFVGMEIGSYAGVNYVPIFMNRGCYFGKCSFCAIPYGWGAGGYDGARPIADVVDDLERLSRVWGVRRFKFVDEAVHPRQMAELSRQIVSRRLSIEWEVYARLESAWYENDFVALVASAGLRKAYFGLELLPGADRESLGKRDQARPDTLLRVCGDNGVLVHLFCMFGFPGTSRADAINTTEYILRHSGEIDSADLFPWTLAKHTLVSGVRVTNSAEESLRLEFDHVGEEGNLSSEAIAALAEEMEELVWEEAPRLLHPIYRMVSPWASVEGKAASDEAAGTADIAGYLRSPDEIGDIAFFGGSVTGDTSHVAAEVADVATEKGCFSRNA